MNKFTKFLENLGALAHLVIILALMAVLCALGFVVLVIAFVLVLFIGWMSNPKGRIRSINPIATIGVAVVTFGVSFAATYFALVFTMLLGLLFGAGEPDAILIVWISLFLFMLIQFVLVGMAGSLLYIFAARFHVIHALAVAGLYVGIWHVYNSWSGPSSLPAWVDYVDYASVFCGVIFGIIVGETESRKQSEMLNL